MILICLMFNFQRADGDLARFFRACDPFAVCFKSAFFDCFFLQKGLKNTAVLEAVSIVYHIKPGLSIVFYKKVYVFFVMPYVVVTRQLRHKKISLTEDNLCVTIYN